MNRPPEHPEQAMERGEGIDPAGLDKGLQERGEDGLLGAC